MSWWTPNEDDLTSAIVNNRHEVIRMLETRVTPNWIHFAKACEKKNVAFACRFIEKQILHKAISLPIENLKVALKSHVAIAKFLYYNSNNFNEEEWRKILKEHLSAIVGGGLYDPDILKLIICYADLSCQDNDNILALAVRATLNNPEVIKTVKFMLAVQEPEEKLASLNGLRDDLTPLMFCVFQTPPLINEAFLLLKEECDLWVENSEKSTALHYAAYSKHTKIVQAILEKIPSGQRKQYIDLKDLEGTALLFALRNRSLEVAHLLLKEGADDSVVASDGYTVLEGAVYCDDLNLTKSILEKHSATYTDKYLKEQILPLATKQGSLDIVLYILQKMKLKISPKRIASIFRGAISEKKKDLIKYMLSSPQFKVKFKVERIFEEVLLSEPDDWDVIRILLEYGADPSLKFKESPNTVFHRAIIKDIPKELLEMMIHNIPIEKRKIFLNIADESTQNTPLMQALQMQRQDLVELLMQHGAEPTSAILKMVLPDFDKLKFLLPQADCVLCISSEGDHEQNYLISINKMWVSEKCSFLRGLFNPGFKESAQKTIQLTEKHPEIAYQLIEFLYTGKLTIHHNNFYQMQELIERYDIPDARCLYKKWKAGHPECKAWLQLQNKAQDKDKQDL